MSPILRIGADVLQWHVVVGGFINIIINMNSYYLIISRIRFVICYRPIEWNYSI